MLGGDPAEAIESTSSRAEKLWEYFKSTMKMFATITAFTLLIESCRVLEAFFILMLFLTASTYRGLQAYQLSDVEAQGLASDYARIPEIMQGDYAATMYVY